MAKQNKTKWDALSMKDRASFIKIGIKNGFTDLEEIRKFYNEESDLINYDRYVQSLPENQRFTPESKYRGYKYWKLNGKPKDFEEAKSKGMYNWNESDQSYHANSISWDDRTGIGHFMKPKTHESVKYELDWYNKGLKTLEGGEQVPLEGEEKEYNEEFRRKYKLDSSLIDYRYIPKTKEEIEYKSFLGEQNKDKPTTPEGLKKFNSKDAYNRAIERGDTIMMSPKEADWWTRNNYKAHYPTFNKYADGGEKGLFDRLESRIANSKLGRVLYNVGILPKAYYSDSDNKQSNNPITDNKRKSKVHNLTRKLPNDSRTTQEQSANLEEDIARRQASLLRIAENKGYPSDDYFIPYILDQEIKTKVGRVSKNMLDSLAVNAEKAGITISEAIGLAALETHFGTAPNISRQGMESRFKKDSLRDPTQEEKQFMDRIIGNTSFARTRGGIYPQFLVNDHEWHRRGAGPAQVKKYKLNDIKSPLEHAFTLYKEGLYNPGESTHTKKVKAMGDDLMTNDPKIKEWYLEYKEKKSKKAKK